MMSTHRGVFYFLCGRAGAGKSTLARRISAEKSAVLFCEDQWLANLFDGAPTLEAYLERRGRIRALLAQHVPEILKIGHSVVFDFGGNTVRDRAWIRSVCESAGAKAELHYIVADEALCKRRVAERNRTRPAGLYWGDVSEEMLDTVNRYFQPPAAEEGWIVVEREAAEQFATRTTEAPRGPA
jgi:predicted kinase